MLNLASCVSVIFMTTQDKECPNLLKESGYKRPAPTHTHTHTSVRGKFLGRNELKDVDV